MPLDRRAAGRCEERSVAGADSRRVGDVRACCRRANSPNWSTIASHPRCGQRGRRRSAVVGRSDEATTVVPQAAPLRAIGGNVARRFRGLASSASDIFPGGRFRARLSESTVGVRSAAESSRRAARASGSRSRRSRHSRRRRRAGDRRQRRRERHLTRRSGSSDRHLRKPRAGRGFESRTIGAIRKTLRRLAKRYPLIRFEQSTQRYAVHPAAIDGVMQTLGEGIVLTVIVMLFFLRLAKRGDLRDRDSGFAAGRIYRDVGRRLHAQRAFADGAFADDRHPG